MKYLSNTITKFSAISILFISTNVFALSEQAIEGKEFYMEANCQKCHGIAPDYNSQNNKAKNIAGLKSWVSNCDASLDIAWFPEEQMSVVKYLNEAHYKFDK